MAWLVNINFTLLFLLILSCGVDRVVGLKFQEQKFLIGLILMVPVYALESVLINLIIILSSTATITITIILLLSLL